MASATGSDVEKASPAYISDEKVVSRPSSSNGDVAVGQVGEISNFEEVGELRQGLQQRRELLPHPLAYSGSHGHRSALTMS